VLPSGRAAFTEPERNGDNTGKWTDPIRENTGRREQIERESELAEERRDISCLGGDTSSSDRDSKTKEG